MDRRNELLLRVYFLLMMFVIAAVVIVYKVVKVSVFEGDRWREQASKNLKWKPVKADRGDIFTEDGKLLASSITFFDIYMDLQSPRDEDFNSNLDSLSFYLSKYVNANRSASNWSRLLKKERKAGLTYNKPGTKYFPIAKNLDYLALQKFKQFPLFRKGQYKGGFIVERISKRAKPFGELASRTIGEDRENADKIGIEGFYDRYLSGETDQKLMKRIGGNIWVPVFDPSEFAPKYGDDLVSTIDVHLQDITHNALERAILKHNARAGTAIIMDVKTGAIKAISNLDNLGNGKTREVYNYAIGAKSEPGSTFKLMTTMALMEASGIQLNEPVSLNYGAKKFYDRTVRDSEPHNITKSDLRQAFAKSSNVGIATLVNDYFAGSLEKRKLFIETLSDMHLNVKTGIEIIGEPDPFIKHPEKNKKTWYGTTIPWMAHGYEIEMTPLQVLTFYNAVANDGKMMKPYLIKERWHDGNLKQTIKPKVLNNQIASEETIKKAQELLEEVVLTGTARNLQSKLYTSAGKTGTARFDYATNKELKRYNASFAGYFPADDPVYSCMIVVYEPKENGYYGGTVTSPVFKEIADQCYTTRKDFLVPINQTNKITLASYQKPNYSSGHKNDLKTILNYVGLHFESSKKGSWAVISPKENELQLEQRRLKRKIVPNVTGMGARDAIYILENLGLNVELQGYGKVTSQSIEPGTVIKGQEILLGFS